MIVSAFFLPLTAYAQSSRYGESFLQAEDFTGDGIPDLIVADPGDFGGIGSLYVFYGPALSDPLPPPSEADEVVQFDAEGLLDTGWRLKQACDYTFDDIADIYVGATILREDGTTADRVLIVTPVSWRILMDVRSDPSLPDFWQSFDGTECENNEWIETVLRDWGYELQGEGDDSPNIDGGDVLNVIDYTITLFHPIPTLWQKNIADFVAITVVAKQGAKNAYPINKSMTEDEKDEARGNRNALRHALWQGLLTRRFGADRAEEIGDIHEEDSENETDSWIDQFNNAVARNIALQCLLDGGCTIQELIRRLLEALEDNRFIKTPCDPRVPEYLRPSDCIDTGDPVPIGDVNSDGSINSGDLLRASLEYGNQFMTADLNSNGIVDIEDLVEITLIIENQQ